MFAFTISSPHMRIESGTCNMCSAPCSSCMHNNRTALAMESRMEFGSSRSSCATKEDDNCSFIYANGMPHCKSRICDDLEHTASEASNFLCSSSSHDSYSECAESKASMKAPDNCEAPENVGSPPVPLRETGKDQFLQDKRSSAGFCLFSSNSHDTPDSCHRTFLKQETDLRGLECHGDNISCISGIKNSNLEVCTCNMDQKNANCSSASAHILLSKEVEDTVQIEATEYLHISENKQRQSNHRKLAMHPKESFENDEYSVKASFSDKSKLEEVHILKHITSPKVQSPCLSSQDEHVFSHNAAFKNSDGSPSCQLRVDVESSLGSQAAIASSLGEKGTLSKHENSKAGYIGNHVSDDAEKVSNPFLENENGLEKGIPSTEVRRTSSVNKEFKISTSVDVSNVQEPHRDMESENSESETELLDVKVCDICGDAGREEKLAFCSRCSDGAEHIYCMRKMLREVPKGDWLCEECQLKEDAERSKKIEMIPGVAKGFRLKDSCEIEVDKSEKLSPTAKEYKLNEYAQGRKGCRSEAVLGTSKEWKEDNGSKKVKVDMSEKLSPMTKEFNLKEYTESRKGSRSEAVPGTSRECKEEDSGSKKVNTSQTVTKMPKLSRLNETRQNFSSISGLKHASKMDMKAVDPDIGRVHKVLQSPRFSAKRLTESRDGEGIEMGSPRKKPALSRENSFKNLDALKTKVGVIPATTESRSANGPKGFFCAQSMLGSHSLKDPAKLQSPRGLISRSSSFNLSLEANVKQLTESVPLKPKMSRVSSFSDTKKEALGRSMAKSASFKSIRSGRSNTESASKVQFIHQSQVEDLKSLKQMNGRNAIEKKRSIHDRPSTISSPRSHSSTTLVKMDMTAGHDVKLNMSESNVVARMSKGSETVNCLGRNEGKRPTTSLSKVPGSVSLNAKVNNEDQRQAPEERAPEGSSSTDKSYNNADTVQNRPVLYTAEPIHRDDNTKESVLSNSRQSVSGRNRVLRCQSCNEIGHTTQFCSIDKLQSSALKPSTENNSKDGNEKDNKWKEIEMDIQKNKLQKNNIQTAQSSEFVVLGENQSCEEASKEFLSSSTVHPRNITFVPGTSNEQEISRRSEADCVKTAHVSDVMLQPCPLFESSFDSRAAQIFETSCSPEDLDLNDTDAVSVELNTRHLLHVLPDQASLLAALFRTPTIPELEFIWQGSLEVRRTWNESASFDGIQAHLSTSASPRVLEVANKMTFKVQLEEVPLSSSWLLQSREISLNEHNIALFFFAKDIDSYERSYSKLLEKMLKYDLALRGIIDDNELLILPSTKLPVHSQRWNRLFFLWGMFKGRNINGLTSKMSQKEASRPIVNMDHATQDPPCALTCLVSSSQKAVPIKDPEKSPRGDVSPEGKACKMSPQKEATILSMDHTTQNPPALSSIVSSSQKAISIEYSGKSAEAKALRSTISVEAWGNSCPKFEDRMFKVQDSPLLHNSSFQSAYDNRSELVQSSHAFPVYHSLSSTNQLSNLSNSHPESRFLISTPRCSEVKNDDTYLKNFGYCFEGRQAVTSTSHTHAINEQFGLSRASVSYLAPDYRKDIESSRSEMRLGEEETSMQDKFNRKHSDLSSTNLISIDINETMVSNDEREQERMCCGEETLSMRSSSKVHPLYGIWNQQSTESLNFFPVELSPVQNNTKPENLINVLSSDNEDGQETKTPNLELSLWGRQNAEKGRQWKNRDEDDVFASLSLSLAVPTLEKEQAKPVANQEQERPDVSTSLLLFGRVINN